MNDQKEEESKDQNIIYFIKSKPEEEVKQLVFLSNLTPKQIKELLLSVRLGEVSHENLIKYSKMNIFSPFKELFIQAMSLKLNKYDSQYYLKDYEFNITPRLKQNDNTNQVGGDQNSLHESGLVLDKSKETIIECHKVEGESTPQSNKLKNNIQKQNDIIKGSKSLSLTNSLDSGTKGHSSQNNIICVPQLPDTSEIDIEKSNMLCKIESAISRSSLLLNKETNDNKSVSCLSSQTINQRKQMLLPQLCSSVTNIRSFNDSLGSDTQRNIKSDRNLFSGLTPEPMKHLSKSTSSIIQRSSLRNIKSGSRNQINNQKNTANSLYSGQEGKNEITHDIGRNLLFPFRREEKGAIFYLGNICEGKGWQNPHLIGNVKVFASSVRIGSMETLVGREVVNFSTLNEPFSYIGVDLGEERYLFPTAYTIRNRNSSTYVMLNWQLEGSIDGQHYIVIDERVHLTHDEGFNQQKEKQRDILMGKGAITSYAINALTLTEQIAQLPYPNAFRFLRIVQISLNSHASHNLCLSGIELYGTPIGNNWNF